MAEDDAEIDDNKKFQQSLIYLESLKMQLESLSQQQELLGMAELEHSQAKETLTEYKNLAYFRFIDIHHSAFFHIAYTNQIFDRIMVLINVELTCGPDGCRACTAFHKNGNLHVVSSTSLSENTNKLIVTCVYITNASPKIWNL